jgi:hypothetical protein
MQRGEFSCSFCNFREMIFSVEMYVEIQVNR